MNMHFYTLVNNTLSDREQDMLYIVLLIGGLANGLFRLIWGSSMNKIGFKIVYLTAMLLNLICVVWIQFAVENIYMFMVVYAINQIVLGGLMVIFPNLCLLVFGEIIGEAIYGYYWAIFTISNFLQYFIGLIIHVNSLTNIFFIFGLANIAGIIVCFKTRFQGRWDNSMAKLENPCLG